jgi:CheY-like chemotaxis protein
MDTPNVPEPLPGRTFAADHLPPGTTVLVVDDEPVVRMLVRMALSKAGVAVAEAADAAEAAAAVRAAVRPFDLILLDLSLPGVDGAALIPEFRRRAPGTRVLVVSGLLEDDGAGLGADGFLAKPFTRSTLVEAVWQVLAAPGRPRWAVDDHTPLPDELR